MECTQNHPECKLEFNINKAQMEQAFKLAEVYSVDTPIEKRLIRIGVPDTVDPDGHGHPLAVYPYVWKSIPQSNNVRLEMGNDEHGRRVFALFTMRSENRFGIVGHISVWLAEPAHSYDLNTEWKTLFSVDVRYHSEAFKMFRGALLRMDLGSNKYVATVVRDLPVPPDEEPLPSDHRLGEIDNL